MEHLALPPHHVRRSDVSGGLESPGNPPSIAISHVSNYKSICPKRFQRTVLNRIKVPLLRWTLVSDKLECNSCRCSQCLWRIVMTSEDYNHYFRNSSNIDRNILSMILSRKASSFGNHNGIPWNEEDANAFSTDFCLRAYSGSDNARNDAS